MEHILSAPVTVLRGVGEKRAAQYARLQVFTVEDLLRLYPRTYEDWSHPLRIADAIYGMAVCIKAHLLAAPIAHPIRKNMTLYRFPVTDGQDRLTVTLFNAAYTAKNLQVGRDYLFFGNVTRRGNLLEMSAPQIVPADRGAYIHPIYPQTAGLTSRMIETNVKEAQALLAKTPAADCIPAPVREQYGLCGNVFALQNIHFPQDTNALHAAKERLIFEELFLFRLGMMRLKNCARAHVGTPIAVDATAAFLKKLPFTPTHAQTRAIADAIADMRRNVPMSRLIQGDVGSGKTAVAAALAYTAAKNGMQTAFMAPTDILARQHAASLQKLLGDECRVALLVSAMPAAEKRQTLVALAAGEIDIAVGTHALISEKVQYRNLGLVITDEQHRFGVAQRTALAQKGAHPHTLVMSATPIPRTLALLVYGDLDVSVLDELPAYRLPIKTYAVDSGKRARVHNFIREHTARGEQCYIVCPLVQDEDNASDLMDATAYFKELQKVFKGVSVALLHGQMPAKEKEAVMSAFAAGEIAVLVSTVVIEVGVDVPNATLMVIENAERFGLAQLHQLRGRVGRGNKPSSCVLISDATGDDAKRRLHMMCKTADGFQIAEEDLQMRGPGDFFGSRQHGLPQMHIASLLTDMQVLRTAGTAAETVITRDPTLSLPEHQPLCAAVTRLFSDQIGMN